MVSQFSSVCLPAGASPALKWILQLSYEWLSDYKHSGHAVAHLVHCATSRKDAGSIPDGINVIFHTHNPSGRTMAQPLTELSTRNISRGVEAAGA
jgi:hypothetical protein